MKANKTKSTKSTTKKFAKKQLELTLTERFLEAIKSLGHNVEAIRVDIAKTSKVMAKKLSKKFKKTDETVAPKLEKIKIDKTAIKKASPAVSSVKVTAIATEKKVEVASKPTINKVAVKVKSPIKKPVAKTTTTTKK